MAKVKVIWDIAEEHPRPELPEIVEIPDDVYEDCEDEDERSTAIADWLTDSYCWCVEEVLWVPE